MIGSHTDPPFVLLESMQRHMPKDANSTMTRLFQEHKSHLDEGVRLRLNMQHQTQSLLHLLPSSFVHQSWEERLQHEAKNWRVKGLDRTTQPGKLITQTTFEGYPLSFWLLLLLAPYLFEIVQLPIVQALTVVQYLHRFPSSVR